MAGTNNKFTLIIRSKNRTNQNDLTRECSVKLNCSTIYSHITVLKNSLSLDKWLETRYEFQSDNFPFKSGRDPARRFSTIAFSNDLNILAGHMRYDCEIFNHMEINFRLINADGSLLTTLPSMVPSSTVIRVPFNKNLICIIECEGL
jgi:hypothetical protein